MRLHVCFDLLSVPTPSIWHGVVLSTLGVQLVGLPFQEYSGASSGVEDSIQIHNQTVSGGDGARVRSPSGAAVVGHWCRCSGSEKKFGDWL